MCSDLGPKPELKLPNAYHPLDSPVMAYGAPLYRLSSISSPSAPLTQVQQISCQCPAYLMSSLSLPSTAVPHQAPITMTDRLGLRAFTVRPLTDTPRQCVAHANRMTSMTRWRKSADYYFWGKKKKFQPQDVNKVHLCRLTDVTSFMYYPGVKLGFYEDQFYISINSEII